MSTGDYAAVAVLWAAYVGVAALCIWAAMRFTRDMPIARRAAVAFVIAIFFAPSVIGGGHGGGVGPAWMALSQMYPLKLGVLPMVVTFAISFAIGSVIALLGSKK